MLVRSWSFKLLVQNKLDFIKTNNGLQGNCCILKTDIAWGLQKLGLILENKVHLNLKVAKGIININCSYDY